MTERHNIEDVVESSLGTRGTKFKGKTEEHPKGVSKRRGKGGRSAMLTDEKHRRWFLSYDPLMPFPIFPMICVRKVPHPRYHPVWQRFERVLCECQGGGQVPMVPLGSFKVAMTASAWYLDPMFSNNYVWQGTWGTSPQKMSLCTSQNGRENVRAYLTTWGPKLIWEWRDERVVRKQ